MVQSISQQMSFEQFLDWDPQDGKRYELVEGRVREMMPAGSHELVCSFLAEELTLEIRRLSLPYRVSRFCLVKVLERESGFVPDIGVLDLRALPQEPLWSKSSVIQQGETIPLVVEVVSSNWRDDYAVKLAAYEDLGILEYWIVDHEALGAVRYIGNPKQPTVTICKLIEGEYQLFPYVAGQALTSIVFPELDLPVERILEAGREG